MHYTTTAPASAEASAPRRVVNRATEAQSDLIASDVENAPVRGERLVSVCVDENTTTMVFVAASARVYA